MPQVSLFPEPCSEVNVETLGAGLAKDAPPDVGTLFCMTSCELRPSDELGLADREFSMLTVLARLPETASE